MRGRHSDGIRAQNIPEEHEDTMGYSSPSGSNNLKPSVSVGSVEFEFGSQHGEEQNLDGCTG